MFFFFNPEESHYLKNKNKTKRNQTKQYKTKQNKTKQNKTKNGVTTFLAVYCFPGSHFSTFSHNSFFYVCLFVSYCFVFEEREVINWMACVIPATHSINYLKFWFCWLIEGRVNQLALFLFDFKVKPCEFLRKKKRNDSGAVKNAVSTLFQHEVRYFNVCLALIEIYSFAVFPYSIKVIVNNYRAVFTWLS